jgi:hypothetical protein
MAGANDGKASPGSPFKPPPARLWNNMVDAGRAWADGRLNNGTPNPTGPRDTDIIKIKNNSGAIRRKGEILKISGKAVTDIDAEHIWLLGVEPTDGGYFGILKEPVDTSKIGQLQVSGTCMAIIDIDSTSHRRAEAVTGQYVLKSSESGPIEILYAPSVTGEQECVVRFAGTGGGGSGIHGIVSESHGKGYYTVELAEWSGITPDCGTGECDPCEQVNGSHSGSTDDNCDNIALPDFERQTVGIGVFVLAYHRKSVIVPLEIGSDCLMMDLGDTNGAVASASGGASSSSGGDEPVYQIVDGYQTHITEYKEEWVCCNGVQVMTRRTAIIFAGIVCEEAVCNVCDEPAP